MIRSLLVLFSLLTFYSVKDISMEPRLYEGDRILVFHGGRVKKGTMAVVYTPEGDLSVKTCVLTEDDEIQIEGPFLRVEGKSYFLQPYQREYLLSIDRVPRGQYFFIGENSYHSHDSRDWGFLEKKDIIGKVIAVRRMNR